jgi:transcriptional regulator with XRE-family HTH domain
MRTLVYTVPYYEEMVNNKILVALGIRIKTLRTKHNISQQELAGICDFEKANMSRIENGGTNPTIITLQKICTALQINLADLFDTEELKNIKEDE